MTRIIERRLLILYCSLLYSELTNPMSSTTEGRTTVRETTEEPNVRRCNLSGCTVPLLALETGYQSFVDSRSQEFYIGRGPLGTLLWCRDQLRNELPETLSPGSIRYGPKDLLSLTL